MTRDPRVRRLTILHIFAVMSDGSSGHRTNDSVMFRDIAGNAAYCRSREATLGIRHTWPCNSDRGNHQTSKKCAHVKLQKL